MRPYSYNQCLTCKSWLKAYNAMHLLPQITVTAVLMTDKTLSVIRWSKTSLTPFELDFHIMLSARFWYNTNADDAVLLNYCIPPPPNTPAPYPMVLWNAATARARERALLSGDSAYPAFTNFKLIDNELWLPGKTGRLVTQSLVSASDVTPTDRWLNVWCIWHTYLETLQECRSHHRIGWIIQDFRETCL